MVSTEVLDRHKDGLGKRVRLFVDAKVRKVDYTLDYRYERPTKIEWDFVEGNGIDDADGHYLFESLGDDRTRATYKLGLEVGHPGSRPGRPAGAQADAEGLGRGPEARGRAARDRRGGREVGVEGEAVSRGSAAAGRPMSARTRRRPRP